MYSPLFLVPVREVMYFSHIVQYLFDLGEGGGQQHPHRPQQVRRYSDDMMDKMIKSVLLPELQTKKTVNLTKKELKTREV